LTQVSTKKGIIKKRYQQKTYEFVDDEMR